MQGLICCLVFLSLALPVMAEDGPPTLLWTVEPPDWIHEIHHIVESQSGGFIAATVTALPHKPVVRFDENGNVLWEGGMCGIGFAYWVEELPDGNIVATGWGTDPEQTVSGLWITKVTADGDPLWYRVYWLTSADRLSVEGHCIQVLPDGGFAVCGHVRNYDPWLLRTDSQGDTLWTRVWEPGWARARRVVYHDNGLVMFVDGSYGYGPLLIRYDLDGNLEWVSDFTGEYESSTDWGGSMCMTPGGGGYTFVSEYYSWIVGTDWSGEEQWSQEIFGDMGRVGLSINPTMDGGYIFSGKGSHWSPPQTVDTHSAPADTGSTWDGWLVKMDSLGNHEWHVFNSLGTRDNYFNCVQQLSQGGYIVAGQIWDTVHSSWNGYLLRYAPETGIEGDEPVPILLTLAPSSNPFTTSVSITCNGEVLPDQLMVYDITGRLIRSLSDRQGASFLWDGRDASGADLPRGTYLIRGAIDGRVSSIRVVRL